MNLFSRLIHCIQPKFRKLTFVNDGSWKSSKETKRTALELRFSVNLSSNPIVIPYYVQSFFCLDWRWWRTVHSCGAKLKPANNKNSTFAENILTSCKQLSSWSKRGWILFHFSGWFRRCTDYSSLVLRVFFPDDNLLLCTRSLFLSYFTILIQIVNLERSKKSIIKEIVIFNGLKINSTSQKCFNSAGKLTLHDILTWQDNATSLWGASTHPISDNSVWWDFL